MTPLILQEVVEAAVSAWNMPVPAVDSEPPHTQSVADSGIPAAWPMVIVMVQVEPAVAVTVNEPAVGPPC